MANKRGQGEGSISKRPDGTWWARITIGKDDNGKQKRKAFYGNTRKEVQEKLTAALSDINDGVYIDPSRMPLEQWLNTWLLEYKKKFVRPTTYRGYYSVMHIHVIPALGKYPLKDIRPDMVQKFINSLSDRPSAARASLEILGGALGQAFKNDLIKRNVASGIILPKDDRPEKVILTKGEQMRFIEATKNSNYGKIFVLILGTGLRIGEALALTWGDIDFDADVLRVSKTYIYAKDCDDPTAKFQRCINSPKTKASNRSVPLLPSIRDMLKILKETQRDQWGAMGLKHGEQNLIFCDYQGKMWLHATVNANFKKIIDQAGLNPTLTIHGLRHTFATRGLENGIPLKVMQEILGHSSLKMTADLYTHVLPETKKDEIIKLADTITIPEGASAESAVLPVLGVECRKCGSTDIVRNGIYKGKQRYLCKKCGYTFIEREVLVCIHCGGISAIKNGKTPTGKQRYLCTKCNRRFVEHDNQAGRVDALNNLHYEPSDA